MPKRSRRTTFSRRRAKRRRRSRFRMVKRMNNKPGMLGKTHRQVFRYVDRIVLNPGLGTLATHIFQANGAYDPDITGTGHQPIAFDQLVGIFYNHYTVIGAKIKCTFIADADAATNQACIVAVETKSSTGATIDYSDLLEHGNSSHAVMTTGTANQKATVTRRVNMSKFLGQKVLQEDANAGTASTNPNEGVFFHVTATAVGNSLDPPALNVLVELDMITILHEPKALVGS